MSRPYNHTPIHCPVHMWVELSLEDFLDLLITYAIYFGAFRVCSEIEKKHFGKNYNYGQLFCFVCKH